MVTACKRDSLDIITVIIGADTKKIRTSDSMKLIEYSFKNYKIINIKKKVEEQFEKWKELNEKRIIINKGKNSKVELKLEDINFEKMAVKNTQLDNITIEINSLYYLEAPIEKNRVIGNVKIMLGKDMIGVLQIYNKNEIEKKDVKSYLMEFLRQIAM